MASETTTSLCEEVAEEMPRIVEGTAAPELYDHIAECDACRDARHDAQRSVEGVRVAGADFEVRAGLEERVLAALDARTATSTSTSAATSTSTATAEPRAPAVVVPLVRQRRFQFGAGAVAIVAAAVMLLTIGKTRHPDGGEVAESAPWGGTVASLARAAGEGSAELLACDSRGQACAPLRLGAAISPGSTLRTDDRTRAQLRMADGTMLVLDRSSELSFHKNEDRFATLSKGGLVADVTHLDSGANARIGLPTGQIEVLGTKFAVVAEADRARVEVTRGVVKLSDDGGREERIRAGEEGRVVRGQRVTVAPSVRIAEEVAWSERAFRPAEEKASDEPLRGLGELRARKPGQTDERDQAVRLAKHDVKVRIVDSFARTEVDETFTNDTGDELEGIFRFPLPPGAQIERLALEVHGKLEEGAFVDKDKAAAIWRGVIHHAAPTAPKPVEEIIWVPGPWRDPALLEWKRGGRFELRIFPIPAHGSRRIVLAYTETVQPVAGVRRYTYPLPYDPRGSTSVESFHFDAQVLGNDRSYGVRPGGYALAAEPSDADRVSVMASKFVPAGDLTLEYALPNPNAELSTWAYQPISTTDDASPYVVLALRPKLPRAEDEGQRDHVLMIDSSRSMVGERFARARSIAVSMVREMSESDRAMVMACDSTCQTWDAGFVGGGRTAAESAERFLAGVTPDGAADMVAMVRAARNAGRNRGNEKRPLHLLYVGDGGASAGPTKPDHLTAELRRVLPAEEGVLNAVAIGADADTTLLAAMARGGGGVVVPFVPGERASEAAMSALEATYGTSLQQPELTLPDGFTYVTPSSLDTIRAGSETLVVGRMTSPDIEGEAILRGRIGTKSFERKYSLHAIATPDAGNAFAPRVYAAARIAELEQAGGDQAKSAIADLSKRFSVASRYTSLLVLESEAMLNAFGIHRASAVPSWTGETAANGKSSDDSDASDKSAADGEADDEFEEKRATKASGMGYLGGATTSGAAAPAATAASPDRLSNEPAKRAVAKPPAGRPIGDPAPLDSRRWIPMHRVWDRKGTFAVDLTGWDEREAAKIIAAEGAALAKPDSRQSTKELYGLYAQHGRLEKAEEIANRWASRDALDPEALMARADLAARNGDRDAAIRILGGVVDIRPDDAAMQKRLAALFDTQGEPERACAHRVALAEQQASDLTVQASAIRCASTLGWSDLSARLRADVASDKQGTLEKALASPVGSNAGLSGDVRIEATWDTDVDVDVALIDKLGHRLSWWGGASKSAVSAKDATSARAEALAFQSLASGSYVVEVTRAKPAIDAAPVHGSLTIHAVGETRVVSFTLAGERADVGKVDVFYTSRLVPLLEP